MGVELQASRLKKNDKPVPTEEAENNAYASSGSTGDIRVLDLLFGNRTEDFRS